MLPGSDNERTEQAILELRGISKAFGPTLVLNGVHFELRPGEIHALMGENGAGKSTLMKIAAGLIQDFEGEVSVDQQPMRFSSPRDAARAGIAIIHQELSLVPELQVDENIFLGQEKVSSLFLVNRSRQITAARSVLQTLDFHAPIRTAVAKLRVGEQQLVEIAKALVANARILIMDEPTSALSINETDRLFQVIRRLAAEQVAIVYISHRMEEVFQVADRLTVLRDGRSIGTVDPKEVSRREIIRMMVGRELQEVIASGKPETAGRKPVLEVRDLSLENPTPTPSRPYLIKNVSFTVASGEVLGLAGLLGAGRTETLEVLFGLHYGNSRGQVWLNGRRLQLPSPAAAKEAGLAFITEDRKRDGLILDFSLARNVELPVMETISRLYLVSSAQERRLAEDTITKLGIVAPRGDRQVAGTLSGGNQQKVVIGKWLQTLPRVLLMDEPTRGIDVGAKAEIYRLIEELAKAGLAIVLVSSELPELMLLSDRILVLREGLPAALLGRDQFLPETILEYASPGGPTQKQYEMNP